MKAQGYGRILNLSSGAGLWGVAGMAGYSTAKMGIVGLTRALAQEGAPHGIRVNAMAPNAKTRPGGFGPIPASPQLHDWLSLDVVAAVAVWLVHEDCDVTGECFTVGGGYVGRVMVAVNDGWRGDRPLTPESVRAGWGRGDGRRPVDAAARGQRRHRPDARGLRRMTGRATTVGVIGEAKTRSA